MRRRVQVESRGRLNVEIEWVLVFGADGSQIVRIVLVLGVVGSDLSIDADTVAGDRARDD